MVVLLKSSLPTCGHTCRAEAGVNTPCPGTAISRILGQPRVLQYNMEALSTCCFAFLHLFGRLFRNTWNPDRQAGVPITSRTLAHPSPYLSENFTCRSVKTKR